MDKEEEREERKLLPSISELFEGSSFKRTHSYEEGSSRKRHSTSIPVRPSVPHTPRSSFESLPESYSNFPSSELNIHENIEASSGKRSFRRLREVPSDYPIGFRFPPTSAASASTSQAETEKETKTQELEVQSGGTSPTDTSRPIHSLKEVDVLSSAFRHTEMAAQTSEWIAKLRNDLNTIIEDSRDIPLQDVSMLEGSLITESGQKSVTRTQFRKWLDTIDIRSLDDSIDNLESQTSFLRNVKLFKKNSKAIVPKTPEGTTSPSTSFTPRHKKSISKRSPRKASRQSSTSELPLLHKPGGEVVPIKVKPPTLEIRSSSAPFKSQSHLRKDLSSSMRLSCSHCGSKDTPEWRKGPGGSRSLCNACGLFYTKLVKKMGTEAADKVLAERKAQGRATERHMI